MAAVESGNVNKFIDMIAHKEELNLDIDYVNDNEQTPLQLAIVSGYAGELFPLISISFFFMWCTTALPYTISNLETLLHQ